MDVKIIEMIFLGSILIQAFILGVAADKISEKDWEVPKLANQGNNLDETAAVRALSLKNTVLHFKENRNKRNATKRGNTEKVGKVVMKIVYFENKPGPTTWSDARAYCMKRGGDLAVTLSDKELEVICKGNPADSMYMWIGARMNGRETEFNYKESYELLTGESISSQDPRWYHNSPVNINNKCVVLNCDLKRKDGKWGPNFHSVPCHAGVKSGGFLCQE